jgi:hypothetical protein
MQLVLGVYSLQVVNNTFYTIIMDYLRTSLWKSTTFIYMFNILNMIFIRFTFVILLIWFVLGSSILINLQQTCQFF